MPDQNQTTAGEACSVCFAQYDERCTGKPGEVCPQPWRAKGPRPFVPSHQPLRSQRTGWQPIETAPKDGTILELARGTGQTMSEIIRCAIESDRKTVEQEVFADDVGQSPWSKETMLTKRFAHVEITDDR